jgi:hypothetical protein
MNTAPFCPAPPMVAEEIARRAYEVTGIAVPAVPRVLRDTSNFLTIERGDILELDGALYVVCGNEHEGRFGIDEQPKYWVKRATSLATGSVHIIKMAFQESLTASIDGQQFTCERDGWKEGQVLQAVCDHPNFMHGKSVMDASGNLLRIIEFIPGKTLLRHLGDLAMPHVQYMEQYLPHLLVQTYECCAGIALLHELSLCHGDIRNDHLILDDRDGRIRWIDFDFARPSLLFDVWCLGNVLNCVLAKGFVTFHGLRQSQPALLARLDDHDASMFFRHRVMNVDKVYPHLPRCFSSMLARFSVGDTRRYERADQFVSDLGECLSALGWWRSPGPAMPT